jgi:hypothetical protein
MKRREEMLRPEIVSEQGPHTILAFGRKRPLLIVDDDKAIQKILARTLFFIELVKVPKARFSSFRQKPESGILVDLQNACTPFFNGVTTFYEPAAIEQRNNTQGHTISDHPPKICLLWFFLRILSHFR